jgi:hypothetical protein
LRFASRIGVGKEGLADRRTDRTEDRDDGDDDVLDRLGRLGGVLEGVVLGFLERKRLSRSATCFAKLLMYHVVYSW